MLNGGAPHSIGSVDIASDHRAGDKAVGSSEVTEAASAVSGAVARDSTLSETDPYVPHAIFAEGSRPAERGQAVLVRIPNEPGFRAAPAREWLVRRSECGNPNIAPRVLEHTHDRVLRQSVPHGVQRGGGHLEKALRIGVPRK